MGDQTQSPKAGGLIKESLQTVKQSITRLFTELRDLGQKSPNWSQVDPVLNRVEASVTNFFTKPEAANIADLRHSIPGDFKELKEVCDRADIPTILPYVAASEGMMTSFLQHWQNAH